MKTFAVIILSANFCLYASFYHSVAVRNRGRSLISFKMAQTDEKKSAFYSKDNNMVDANQPATIVTDKEVVDAQPTRVASGPLVMNEISVMKSRLEEEMRKEDVRATQLESLLGAFQSAADEKQQLIVVEEGIYSQMTNVRERVSDAGILKELDTAIKDKNALIEDETSTCKEVSSVSSRLAIEISDTRENIAELLQSIGAFAELNEVSKGDLEGYQKTLKASIESSRARDEKVLELINVFDEATNKKGLLQGESMPNILKSTISSDGAATSLARLTIDEVKANLSGNTNRELAAAAGQAVGKTATALVAASSSIFTATADFVKSPEAKMSSEAIKAASVAVSDMGKNIRSAWTAASSAYSPTETGSSSADQTINVLDKLKTVFDSDEVKAALNLLGGNAQKTAREAAKAAEYASSQLGSSLKNSTKWQNAMEDLKNSIVLLISILTLSSSRLLVELRTDLNKQLPESN